MLLSSDDRQRRVLSGSRKVRQCTSKDVSRLDRGMTRMERSSTEQKSWQGAYSSDRRREEVEQAHQLARRLQARTLHLTTKHPMRFQEARTSSIQKKRSIQRIFLSSHTIET